MTTREPKRELSSPPDRPSPERSPDALLDTFPAGRPLPDDDPARWQPVTQVLIALTSAPDSSELAGEARALAEFRARPRRAERPSRAPRRYPGWAAPLHRPGPALAAATGAVLVGGLLAVAYAGDLPAAAQRLAHSTIDAPAADRPAAGGSGAGASSGPGTPLTASAGQASSPSGHRPARTGHRDSRPSWSGSPHHHRPSRSLPRTEGGFPSGRPGQVSPSPGQSASPGDSPTPVPTQQPSPSASTAPSAGTPSPSAPSPALSSPSARPGAPSPP